MIKDGNFDMFKMILNIYEEDEEYAFKYEGKLLQNLNFLGWDFDQRVKLYDWAIKNGKFLLCEMIMGNPVRYAARNGHWSVVKFLLINREEKHLKCFII